MNWYQVVFTIKSFANKVEGDKDSARSGEDYDIFGVIDFGDCHENPYVFDLATTIMYMMTQVCLSCLYIYIYIYIYYITAPPLRLVNTVIHFI